MNNIPFPDFKVQSKVDQLTRKKYASRLPEELLLFWDSHGFGSMLDGYLKVIDPALFIDFLQQSYFSGQVSIPIFATAFGEIITWEKNRYLGKIDYPHGKFDIISDGFDCFLSDIYDHSYIEDNFLINEFLIAKNKYGDVLYDECFGHVPLLALGGRDSVESLEKCNLLEHLQLIISFIGQIGDN